MRESGWAELMRGCLAALVISVAAVALFLGAVVWLFFAVIGCGTRAGAVVSSPDGVYEALAVTSDCGATTPYLTGIVVTDRGAIPVFCLDGVTMCSNTAGCRRQFRSPGRTPVIS